MDPDDIRKYGMGCGFVMLAVLCLVYTMPFWWHAEVVPKPQAAVSEPTSTMVAAVPKPANPVEPVKTPAQTLEELSDKDPAEAYERAGKFYREGSEEEKRAAMKVLPAFHMRRFEEARGANSMDEAERVYGMEKELCDQFAKLAEKETPPGLKDALRYMKETVREMGVRRFKEAAASGDVEKIEAELGKRWDDPEGALPEKETLEFLVGRWSSAMDKGDAAAADAAFEKAAAFAVQDVHSVTYWSYRNGPLEEALCKRHPYKELMELGRKSLNSDRPVTALAYLSAAIKMSSAANPKTAVRIGSEEWLERQRLFDESLVGIARLAEAGKLRWLAPDDSENKVEILLLTAANYVRDVDRVGKKDAKGGVPPETRYAPAVKAWDELLRVYLGKLERVRARRESYQTLAYCNEILSQKAVIYVSFLNDCFGPEKVLRQVPDAVRKEVEKKGKTPQEQAFAVQELVRTEAYTPVFPGREEFLKARQQARREMGTELLAQGKYEEAFDYFRGILREAPESGEAADAQEQIAAKIDAARMGKDFSAIYHLASFLIGEMKGMSFPEELRGKLAACLEETASFYENGSPMKRAFMLSLLSDVLVGTDKGLKARDEAMRIGFDAVKQLPLKEQEKPALELPSLVKGCSVDAIKNSTAYHLMAFYDGPEKFFVRLNPYSKGSLALRDGAYEIAVIVTSDSVIPYRSKSAYKSQFLLNNYYIAEKGRDLPEASRERFMGNFTILRLPGDAGKCAVEPESGVILNIR